MQLQFTNYKWQNPIWGIDFDYKRKAYVFFSINLSKRELGLILWL